MTSPHRGGSGKERDHQSILSILDLLNKDRGKVSFLANQNGDTPEDSADVSEEMLPQRPRLCGGGKKYKH